MTGFIPNNIDPQMRRALEDIWGALAPFKADVIDLGGRRLANAGEAITSTDVALLSQIARAAASQVSSSAPATSAPSQAIFNFGAPVPVGPSLQEGSSPYVSRADHVHTLPYMGVTATVFPSVPNNANTIITPWAPGPSAPSPGYFNSATPDRLIIGRSGLHAIGCGISWGATGAAGLREGQLLNAAGGVYGGVLTTGDLARTTYQTLALVVPMAAGDTVRLQVFQNSGGAFFVVPCQLWAFRLTDAP